jgi:hypothetical protein
MYVAGAADVEGVGGNSVTEHDVTKVQWMRTTHRTGS